MLCVWYEVSQFHVSITPSLACKPYGGKAIRDLTHYFSVFTDFGSRKLRNIVYPTEAKLFRAQ